MGILKFEFEDLDFNFFELGLNMDLDAIKDKMKRKEVSEYDIPAFLKDLNEIELCDVFEIGQHRLICGDSTDAGACFKFNEWCACDNSYARPAI